MTRYGHNILVWLRGRYILSLRGVGILEEVAAYDYCVGLAKRDLRCRGFLSKHEVTLELKVIQ